jgi:hypothetical protein
MVMPKTDKPDLSLFFLRASAAIEALSAKNDVIFRGTKLITNRTDWFQANR